MRAFETKSEKLDGENGSTKLNDKEPLVRENNYRLVASSSHSLYSSASTWFLNFSLFFTFCNQIILKKKCYSLIPFLLSLFIHSPSEFTHITLTGSSLPHSSRPHPQPYCDRSPAILMCSDSRFSHKAALLFSSFKYCKKRALIVYRVFLECWSN